VDDTVSQYDVHDARTHSSRRARRSGRGSLKGELTLADDWDSPQLNDAIARDFGPTDVDVKQTS